MRVAVQNYHDKPVSVELFQLLQFKHALRIERDGGKFSRGSVTAHVRRCLSAPATYPRDDLIDHIDLSLDNIEKELKKDG